MGKFREWTTEWNGRKYTRKCTYVKARERKLEVELEKGVEREKQRASDTEKLQRAECRPAMQLAFCTYKTMPCFITVGCGIVLTYRTNCFLPCSFRAADIINTGSPMGNNSPARIHRLHRLRIVSYRFFRDSRHRESKYRASRVEGWKISVKNAMLSDVL